MKRKKGGGGGGANWMDTYGDMVTLLLCFFVLLYSMSTISEENWRALVMSFNPNAILEATQTSGNEGSLADPPEEDQDNPGSGFMDAEGLQEIVERDMSALFEALQAYASQAAAQNSISVTRGSGKIYISFDNSVFFDGDSPSLRPESYPILDAISDMFVQAADSIDEIRVQGHTAQEWPDRENNINVDRTLSSQRAANVVIYIQEQTDAPEEGAEKLLDPARLVSEGLGQWHPVDTNDTAEGRARNRRVEIIVSGRNIEEEMGAGVLEYTTQPEDADTAPEGGSSEDTQTGDAGSTAVKPEVPES